MTKVNTGKISSEGNYVKQVSFSKAVLWKDRELSVPARIMKIIQNKGCEHMIFIDKTKKERWIFKTKKVVESMHLKQVGQEPQYYFPIELAKKEPIKIRS